MRPDWDMARIQDERNVHLVAENSVSASATKGLLRIEVHGRLGLNMHGEFRRAYQPFLRGVDRCEVDMSACTGIDSSGMALLLILRDQTHLDAEQLLIKSCNPDVARVLGYANFDKLFTINPQ